DNKKKILDAMEEAMKADRARHTILPMTKFGLMQITRQRLRPEINITTAEVCPSCKGTGKIGPSILLADDIEKDLKYLVNQGHRELALHIHPILEAYLTKGSFFKKSILAKWQKEFKVRLKLVTDNNAGL